MPIRSLKLKILFVVERDGDEFHAYCPDLKGIHVGGATESEAIENGKKAVELYVLSLLKHDEPLPVGVLDRDRTVSIGDLLKHFLGRVVPTQRHAHIEEISVQAA